MRGRQLGDPADWERLESLYSVASSLPAAEQVAFLDAECKDNQALRRELADLLACSPDAVGFFDRFGESIRAAISAPPTEFVDPLFGATIGHYRVEGRLGAGGMGVVYRAYDLQLQRTVALKLLSSHLTEDEHARQRFLTEARAAAALDHPNICAIHEIGETDTGLPFIALAFCSGETLKTKIARASLTIPDAANIALQVARGLATAHVRGIIHRDVKPANVMIGEDGLVKLVDFGLARLADTTVTTSAMARGTFAYMAPELLRGQHADASTDLWSLGVVLYEMLTGLRPFRADSDAALLFAIAHQRPEPIATVLPEVPYELRAIVERLLHEDPAARYHDAREVAADLAALIGTSAHTAPAGRRTIESPARVPRRREWQWRQWIAATAAAALVVTVVLLTLRDRSGASIKASSSLPRVAVLPFQDDTQDRSAGAVANAVRAGLIDALSVVPGLDVPSLHAMQPYRDRSLSITSIASELGAGWLVGGIVERSRDRIVATAELSDSTGRRLDFRRVERSAAEESLLIDEIVEAVAFMLRARVGEAVREQRWRAGTTKKQARAHLERATRYREDADSLVQRSQPHAALPELYRADSALARAALADPKWAEPLIERAWVARDLGFTMFGLLGPDSAAAALERGIQHANAALKLQKDSARAYEVRGELRHAQTLVLPPGPDATVRARQLADAERDLTIATESDPALPRALNTLSAIHFARGDFERARLTTERAYRADYFLQSSEILFRLFNAAFETGQDSLARNRCALIARRLPEEHLGAQCRLQLMTWSSDEPNPDSARQLAARAIAATPVAIRPVTEAQLNLLVVGVMARSVSRDSVARALDRARASASNAAQLSANNRQVLRRVEAGVRVRMGDTDGAVELIRRYLDSRPDSRAQLSNSRIFRTLFNDPRLRQSVAN